jgi:chromate transport protein ChrA
MTHVTATLVTRSVTGFAVAFTASDIGWQAARSWGHVTGLTVNPFVVLLAGAVLMAAFTDAALHVPDEAIDTLGRESREAVALLAVLGRWLWNTGRRARPSRSWWRRPRTSRHSRKAATP